MAAEANHSTKSLLKMIAKVARAFVNNFFFLSFNLKLDEFTFVLMYKLTKY